MTMYLAFGIGVLLAVALSYYLGRLTTAAIRAVPEYLHWAAKLGLVGCFRLLSVAAYFAIIFVSFTVVKMVDVNHEFGMTPKGVFSAMCLAASVWAFTRGIKYRAA
jgi:hypothetical protein